MLGAPFLARPLREKWGLSNETPNRTYLSAPMKKPAATRGGQFSDIKMNFYPVPFISCTTQ